MGTELQKTLSDLLKSNTTLTGLILGTYTAWHVENNKIGVEGAKLMNEGLKENHKLKLLSLSAVYIITWIEGNKIGDEGAKLILETLKSNYTLDTLILG